MVSQLTTSRTDHVCGDIRVRMASLIALPPRKYPNLVDAAASLAACASPDAYYKLGIDMLITGLSGVAREFVRKDR
jgi:TetR/AcrR family transcriptional regulator, tetracycline repressor protein